MDSKQNNLKYSSKGKVSSDDELAELKQQMKTNLVGTREERKRINRLTKRVTRATTRAEFQRQLNPSLHDDDDFIAVQRINTEQHTRQLRCQWGKGKKRQRHNLTIVRIKGSKPSDEKWEVVSSSFKNFRSIHFDTKDERFPDGVFKVKCRMYETTLFQSSMGTGALYQSQQLEREIAEKLKKEEKEVLRLCEKANEFLEAVGVDSFGVMVDEEELERFMKQSEEEVALEYEQILPRLPNMNNPKAMW